MSFVQDKICHQNVEMGHFSSEDHFLAVWRHLTQKDKRQTLLKSLSVQRKTCDGGGDRLEGPKIEANLADGQKVVIEIENATVTKSDNNSKILSVDALKHHGENVCLGLRTSLFVSNFKNVVESVQLSVTVYDDSDFDQRSNMMSKQLSKEGSSNFWRCPVPASILGNFWTVVDFFAGVTTRESTMTHHVPILLLVKVVDASVFDIVQKLKLTYRPDPVNTTPCLSAASRPKPLPRPRENRQEKLRKQRGKNADGSTTDKRPVRTNFEVKDRQWEYHVVGLQKSFSAANGAGSPASANHTKELVVKASRGNLSTADDLVQFVNQRPEVIFNPTTKYTAEDAAFLAYRDLALEFLGEKLYGHVPLLDAKIAFLSHASEWEIGLDVPTKYVKPGMEFFNEGIAAKTRETAHDVTFLMIDDGKGENVVGNGEFVRLKCRASGVIPHNTIRALRHFSLLPRASVLIGALRILYSLSAPDLPAPTRLVSPMDHQLFLKNGLRRAFELIFPTAGKFEENPPVRGVEGLNEAQSKAVRRVVNWGRDLTIVKGPPGTGKTSTCANVILHFLTKFPNRNVLATANTNSAVDTIVSKVQAVAESGNFDVRLKVVRLGSRQSIQADFVNHEACQVTYVSSDNPEYSLEVEKIGAGVYRMVAITADSLMARTSMFLSEIHDSLPFDLLVLDEAGRMPLARSMAAFALGKQILMLGDEDQMHPYVNPNLAFLTQFDLDQSVMAYARQANELQGSDPRVVLTENYRSIREVLEPLNEMVYADNPLIAKKHDEMWEKVMSHRESENFQFLRRLFPAGPGISVLPVAGNAELVFEGTTSASNLTEVGCIMALLREFTASGLHATATLGVICFYLDQELILRECMNAEADQLELALIEPDGSRSAKPWVTVGSTERQQGREFDYVVISATKGTVHDSIRDQNPSDIGFLDDKTRLNVALSRARLGVVVVLRPAPFCRNHMWSKVIRKAVLNGQVIQDPKYHACPSAISMLEQWAVAQDV